MNLTRNTTLACGAALAVITGSASAQPTSFSELFKAPISLPAGLRPYDVKAGDFNGDGRPDVAVVNRGVVLAPPNGPNTNFGVSVYLADPTTGQLVKSRTDLTALLSEPLSLAVGDLNGDGLDDLVVGDFGFGGVVSFRGNTALGIDPGTAIFSAADTGTASVDLGFMDSGSVLDAVTVNNSTSKVSLLIGDGTGAFGAAVNTGTIGGARFIRIGNLDLLGVNDVMVVGDGGSTTRLHFSNNGQIFNTSLNLTDSTSGSNVHEQGALGDINGDGKTDVAVTNNNNGGTIVLFTNGTVFDNNPFYAPPTTVLVGPSPYSVALGDLDGDGDQDMVVTHKDVDSDDITVVLNDGMGGFGAQLKFVFSAGFSPRSIELVDLDMDGDLDLLTTRKPDNDSANGELLIFENLTIPNADLNGDGVVDGADLAILLVVGDEWFRGS